MKKLIEFVFISICVVFVVGCSTTKTIATQKTAEGDIVPTRTGVIISSYHNEVTEKLQKEKNNLNVADAMAADANNSIKSLDLKLSSEISELSLLIVELENKKREKEDKLNLLSGEKVEYFSLKAILDEANNDIDGKISASKDASNNFAVISPITGEKVICGLESCPTTYEPTILEGFMVEDLQGLQNRVKALSNWFVIKDW